MGHYHPHKALQQRKCKWPTSAATVIRRTHETADVALWRVKNDSRTLYFPSITSSSLSLISSFTHPKERLRQPYRAVVTLMPELVIVSLLLYWHRISLLQMCYNPLCHFTNLVSPYIRTQSSYLLLPKALCCFAVKRSWVWTLDHTHTVQKMLNNALIALGKCFYPKWLIEGINSICMRVHWESIQWPLGW